MPDDKIEISFDDDSNGKNDTGKDEERIVIDFNEDVIDNETEGSEEQQETEAALSNGDHIRAAEFDSAYKANSQLNSFFPSEIEFPEGIESGFREGAKADLKDSFLNSILENNRYIIASSVNGMIYFVDRFTKKLYKKVATDHAPFEKTGLVYKNVLYANSVNSIYRVDDTAIENGAAGHIYRCEPRYYIWSSLNRAGDVLLFLEYNPDERSGNLVMYDTMSMQKIHAEKTGTAVSLNQLLCVIEGKAYFIADGYLYMWDVASRAMMSKKVDFGVDEGSFLLGNGNKLYLTSNDGKIYFLDNASGEFKFTGIVEHNVNSIAGFDGNLFIGTHEGWKYYNSNGVLVYSHEDVMENKIEAVSKKILVVSRRNKIVFHNLSRFQEAEGFVIKTEDDTVTQDIISVIISFNEVYTLTKQGVLTSFTNDKMNIHV